MTMRTIAAGLVALTLAACGGDVVVTGSPPWAGAETGDARVAQFAGLVAGHEDEWRDSVANIHDTCADSNAPDVCAAAFLTASRQAETLRSALSAAPVHEVPAEIAALVADTEAAAADYGVAFAAWEATNCANPIDFKCSPDKGVAMSRALGELTRKFDAWQPYTG
jgi:hypothetical protein